MNLGLELYSSHRVLTDGNPRLMVAAYNAWK